MAAGSNRDYYEILGVARSATPEAIKSAFRKLAMEFHPDRNPDGDATERFKEIGQAYEVLSDPEKRAKYDRFGAREDLGTAPGFQSFDFGGFGDIFEAFFGGRRTRRGPTRGADLRVILDLEFDEAAFGVEKEVSVSRLERCSICVGRGAEPGSERETCAQCRGSGEIRRAQRSVFGQFVNLSVCDHCDGEGATIASPCRNCGGVGREQRNRRLKVHVPAGVDDHSQMRLSGEGEAGLAGGSAGNLYVQLNVKPHPLFEREENDLILALPVSIAQAALGTSVEVPTLDGEPVSVAVPAGTQSGHTLRLRGQGVPHLHGRGRGDLLVCVDVRVPSKLTAEQRALLEQLDGVLGAPSRDGHDGGLFSRIKDAFNA